VVCVVLSLATLVVIVLILIAAIAVPLRPDDEIFTALPLPGWRHGEQGVIVFLAPSVVLVCTVAVGDLVEVGVAEFSFSRRGGDGHGWLAGSIMLSVDQAGLVRNNARLSKASHAFMYSSHNTNGDTDRLNIKRCHGGKLHTLFAIQFLQPGKAQTDQLALVILVIILRSRPRPISKEDNASGDSLLPDRSANGRHKRGSTIQALHPRRALTENHDGAITSRGKFLDRANDKLERLRASQGGFGRSAVLASS